jgi:ankyrin repeat protein
MIKPIELESEDNRGVWEMLSASADGDVTTIRHWLKQDPKLSRAGYWYLPAVHFAVREGHLEAVRLLLDAGADPEANGLYGVSLVEMARERGGEDIARAIEEARARRRRVVKQPANHPIHAAVVRAVLHGDIDGLRVLLDSDATLVNLGDRAGGTPLHRAVIGRSGEVVTLLLDRGADVHARGFERDVEPIDLAIWGERTEQGNVHSVDVARLLVSRGATYDLTIAAALGDLDDVRRMLDKSPSLIGEARPSGRRPLSTAIEFRHDDIARLLLERGAHPQWDEPDAPHGTALHVAARMGNLAMVKLLLERGADPNEPIDSTSSPLTFAATPEVRETIARYGGSGDWVWDSDDDQVIRRIAVDPEVRRNTAWVFTSACTLGRRALLPRLFEAGLQVPEIVTVCQGYLLAHADMLRMLLAHGMSPDVMNWQRQTLLHLACEYHGHDTERAAILLDAGANITARDDDYRSTPLAWAARRNAPSMVEFLLSRAAPTNLPDDEPWATPLAWATRRGHTQVVEMLRAAGAS